MSKMYAGDAVFSFPDGPTVTASVDLSNDEDGTLVVWSGTAENTEVGSLWNGGQRACTIRFGDAGIGYRVGECMIIAHEPADGLERVSLRGSGALAEVAADDQ